MTEKLMNEGRISRLGHVRHFAGKETRVKGREGMHAIGGLKKSPSGAAYLGFESAQIIATTDAIRATNGSALRIQMGRSGSPFVKSNAISNRITAPKLASARHWSMTH